MKKKKKLLLDNPCLAMYWKFSLRTLILSLATFMIYSMKVRSDNEPLTQKACKFFGIAAMNPNSHHNYTLRKIPMGNRDQYSH